MSPIGLYFHIPFCTKKCAYCHFYVLPDKDPFKVQLLKGVRLEWERWLPFMQGKSVSTIYFGGGTPALIGAEAISEILLRVKNTLSYESDFPEITLEANPENITPELMHDYFSAGINRVSIGIQSLDKELLGKLGRLHSAEKAMESVWMTREAGIENISVDLMYDLPGQTMNAWESTLQQVCQLPISHLSLYNLTIEPHTVFFKYQKAILSQLPDAEVSLQMYERAIEMLESCGLKQYEISAFAKDGCIAKHNVGYWTGRPFLGFGPSAFSYWEGKRFRNVANLSRYYRALEAGESPIDFEEQLSKGASQRELLAIHLRLLSGVNMREFENAHGELEEEVFGILRRLEEEEFLEKDEFLLSKDDVLRLTKKGILFYDSVASEII